MTLCHLSDVWITSSLLSLSEHTFTQIGVCPHSPASHNNDSEQRRQITTHGQEKGEHAFSHEYTESTPEKHARGRPGPALYHATDRANGRAVQPPALRVLLPGRAAPGQLRVRLLWLRHLHRQRGRVPGVQGGSSRGTRRRQVQPGTRVRRSWGCWSRLWWSR